MEQDCTDDDPMRWDVETVSTKLCSPGRPWLKDSAALAQSIKEQELDGQTLLTYDLCFSRRELMQALGFSTARQQASIVREIIGLQARSKSFRIWKKELQTDLDVSAPSTSERAAESRPTADQTPQPPAGTQAEPVVATPSATKSPVSTTHSEPTELADGERRPAKRLRIVPVQVDTTQHPYSSLLDPAFRVPDPAVAAAKPSSRDPDPFAYLGETVLNLLALTSSAGVADFQLPADSDESFTFVTSTRPPPGLRRVVAESVRGLLRRNGRQERLLREGMAPLRSSSPSDESDLDREISWSDLPEELDEETRKEVEEEEAETLAREREIARCLPPERVETILQEAMASMKAKWEEKKLPRYQRQAYKLWTDARKSERTKATIFDAQQQAQHFDERIRRLKAEIVKDRWQKEQDVRDQALILEQSLDDKLQRLWLVNLLQSRVQPDKPITVPRARKPPTRTSLLEDEVLTSDDDMADFIVQDEEPSGPPSRITNGIKRSSSPTPAVPPPDHGDIEMIDLTQIETPPASPIEPRPPVSVEVSNPNDADKSKTQTPGPGRALPLLDGEALVQPPLHQLDDISAIAKHSPKYWERQKDRWRLAISLMMNRIPHPRRQDMLQMLVDSQPEQIWEENLKLHIESPNIVEYQLEWATPARLIGIDFTLVFLSFLKLKAMTWPDIWKLEKGDRKLLKRQKGRAFATFAAFLEGCASRFPTDRQIHRIEVPVDASAAQQSPNGQPSGRRRVVKEVVQDRDALDLRDREERRIREQDARRQKLRAALASSKMIASDQSRLIINESKQEDQAFIYINQDIGKRIKNHQVDGVRFLWNSIIRDADDRQGCLLAHTMGLGKTMQVITFLVAIREAATSSDSSVSSLIPEDLRKSQSLIICPASLVDNWMDEVLLWAPRDLLGHFRKIESAMSKMERLSTLQEWAESGGLLIIGYPLFTSICSQSSDAQDPKFDPSMQTLLLDTPNLVVADEAHYFKNSSTKGHQACSRFKTGSRIALTGTPLANNVDEYYAMIDWVAPNFLGPSKEFNQIYSNPIHDGLDADSSPAQKKEALKKLEALKRTVAPKVDRAVISCIKDDLPPKHEFDIFVPPTPLQRRLYNLYMENLPNRDQQPTVFGMINELTLICNHPRTMRIKAEATIKKAPAKSQLNRAKGADKEETGSEEPAPVSEVIASLMLKETNSLDMNVPSLSLKVELLLLILEEARRLKDKVLVFSQSILTLDYLENLLKTKKRLVLRLDGSTKMSARHDMIKDFNRGEQEVYLISAKAGGVGLNIHGANRVVLFDIKWNPVTDQQAVGRAYRIGQRKPVYVYRLLVAGTCEEVLHSKSIFKTQLASRLVDKKNPVSWGKRLGVFDKIRVRPSQALDGFLHRDVILDKLIGHKPKGEAINRIVSSDTFEEEDHASQMTAEERGQVEEFMRLETIRLTNPAQYDTEMGRIQMRELGALRMPQAGSVGASQPFLPSNFQQNMHGMNAPFSTQIIPGLGSAMMGPPANERVPAHSQHPVQPPMPVQPSLPVPPPIAGANTFFVESAQPAAAPQTQTVVPPAAPENGAQVSQSKTGSIFSSPSGQLKESFEDTLAKKLGQAHVGAMLRTNETNAQMASNMTAAIFAVLRQQDQGFLHDDSRWSLLSRLCENDRFVLAVVSGLLRPDILASVTADELEGRATSLQKLSDEQFEEQLLRVRGPDHTNLGNIGRSHARTARGREDLAVMQQTAQRRQRLPNWANEALAQDAMRASPGFTNGGLGNASTPR